MKVRISKEINFAASHRLMHHQGACANLHGHNYKVILHLDLDRAEIEKKKSGMVMDFSQVKNTIGAWIMKYLDHALIVNREENKLIADAKERGYKLHRMKGEPTAENMAIYLLDCFPELSAVTIYETDSSCAHAEREA